MDATLLAKNSQHCCMLHVAPSVCTPWYMLLGVVARSLKLLSNVKLRVNGRNNFEHC